MSRASFTAHGACRSTCFAMAKVRRKIGTNKEMAKNFAYLDGFLFLFITLLAHIHKYGHNSNQGRKC